MYCDLCGKTKQAKWEEGQISLKTRTRGSYQNRLWLNKICTSISHKIRSAISDFNYIQWERTLRSLILVYAAFAQTLICVDSDRSSLNLMRCFAMQLLRNLSIKCGEVLYRNIPMSSRLSNNDLKRCLISSRLQSRSAILQKLG